MTKNACTNLEIFDIWSKVNSEEVPPKKTTTVSRRTKANNSATTTEESFATILKQALESHSKDIMTKLQDMNVNESGQEELRDNDNSNNTTSNPYSDDIVIEPSLSSPSTLPIPIDPLQNNPQAHTSKMPSDTISKAVIDSGSTHTLSGDQSHFKSITYYDTDHLPDLTLGDNETTCQIHGYGYIRVKMGSYTLQLLALFVPDLQDTLLVSIKQHMQYEGNYFHAENHTVILAYSNFCIDLYVHDEIEIPIAPSSTDSAIDFDEQTATPTLSSSNSKFLHLVKQNIQQFLPSTCSQS